MTLVMLATGRMVSAFWLQRISPVVLSMMTALVPWMSGVSAACAGLAMVGSSNAADKTMLSNFFFIEPSLSLR